MSVLSNNLKYYRYSRIWRNSLPRALARIANIYTRLATEPIINQMRSNCMLLHFNNNITHYNKGLLVRNYIRETGAPDGVVNVNNFCRARERDNMIRNVCFSDIQDSHLYNRIDPPNRNPNNQCSTQPKDLSYTGARDLGIYSRRGGSTNGVRAVLEQEVRAVLEQEGHGYPKSQLKNNIKNKLTSNKYKIMSKLFCKLFYEYELSNDSEEINKNIDYIKSIIKEIATHKDKSDNILKEFKTMYPLETKDTTDYVGTMLDPLPSTIHEIIYSKLCNFIDGIASYMRWVNPIHPENYANVYFKIVDKPEKNFIDILENILYTVLNDINSSVSSKTVIESLVPSKVPSKTVIKTPKPLFFNKTQKSIKTRNNIKYDKNIEQQQEQIVSMKRKTRKFKPKK